MKHHPLFIILWTISRYITDEQLQKVKQVVGKYKLIGPATLQKTISEHMDLEVLIKKPQIWEDAWVYNYLKYETKYSYPKSKLIKRYEREVVIPAETNFREVMGWLNLK
jgi:hypothetical protein